MDKSKRLFIKGAGVALAAPAVVKAEHMMKLWVPDQDITRSEQADAFYEALVNCNGEIGRYESVRFIEQTDLSPNEYDQFGLKSTNAHKAIIEQGNEPWNNPSTFAPDSYPGMAGKFWNRPKPGGYLDSDGLSKALREELNERERIKSVARKYLKDEAVERIFY